MTSIRHLGFRVLVLVASTFEVSAQPVLAPEARMQEVTDDVGINLIVARLQRDLRDIGSAAHIKTCSPVLDYRPSIGRNFSYGASCLVDVGAGELSLIMCGNWMLGGFALSRSAGSGWDAVREYVLKNCPPGG